MTALEELAAPGHTAIVTQERQGAVRVVHCLVQRRPDGRGSNHDAKVFAGPEPTDFVLSRWRGVGPMGGTDLDVMLRSLGVSTVVPRDAVAGIPAAYGDAASTTRCRCWRPSPRPKRC